MRIDAQAVDNLKVCWAIRNTSAYDFPGTSKYIGWAHDPKSMVHLSGAQLFGSYGEAKFLADRITEANPIHYLYVCRVLVGESDVD